VIAEGELDHETFPEDISEYVQDISRCVGFERWQVEKCAVELLTLQVWVFIEDIA